MGEFPIVVDAGLQCPPISREAPPSDLKLNRELNSLPASAPAGITSVTSKAWHGSFHSYLQPHSSPITYAQTDLPVASFGFGGLSRVWGATMRETDWSRWPLNCQPTEADRRAVNSIIPSNQTKPPGSKSGLTADLSSDNLKRRFDISSDQSEWRSTYSRLAIRVNEGLPTDCTLCRGCIAGCESDSIWCASDLLNYWQGLGLIEYVPGVVIHGFLETDLAVEIRGEKAGQPFTLSGSRLFIGAGPIGTAAILVNSNICERVLIADTATIFAGVLDPLIDRPSNSHSLSQWWIDSADRRFSAQMYAPDYRYRERIASRLGLPARLSAPLTFPARFIHPLIAYAHQSKSGMLSVLRTGTSVQVAVYKKPSTDAYAPYLASLADQFRRAGTLFPKFLARPGTPGSGYHLGSSIPHGDGSDFLGRPGGLRRVHVVDASVLPEIPLGSVTPTVMINAHRIARSCLSLGNQS